MSRVHNFNAGPAALPLPVLEKAQTQMLEFESSGMSLMELSHRSKDFAAVIDSAEANVRKLMGVPEEYAVLFLQGGASLQFVTIPMNLRREGKSADYINTGSWASKAIKEAKLTGKVNVVWDGKETAFNRAPKPEELTFTEDAEYVHICSNETIGGIRYAEFPKTSIPVIADMSSEIMSRVVNVSDFGMIYAGAQKNLGPSGLALVIIRKDLIERCSDTVPVFLRYKTHSENASLYNTPNTWGIYILKMVTDWLNSLGGLAEIEKINEAKASLLYSQLDSSDYYKKIAEKDSRSIMNVVWRLPSEELEAKFVAEAKQAGFIGLKGHRSVGGIRASIYNAVPTESVQALVDFMKDFEKNNG